jgi:hypothetical protein
MFQSSCYWSNVGIHELSNNFSFSISPNPSSGIVNLEIGNRRGEVEIYNPLGEKVFQSAIDNSKSEIDLRSKPKGIYFVHVKDEKGGSAVRKLILH